MFMIVIYLVTDVSVSKSLFHLNKEEVSVNYNNQKFKNSKSNLSTTKGGGHLNLKSGIMAKTACTVPTTQIILDEEIYPRSDVYPKRVSMFAENIRDGFKIDPVEVQIHPEYDDKYRILDGAHRWHAYKEIGATEIPVHIITLDGLDPLLYAAKKAIGPLQLTEDEARTTARRAYENNPRLTSFEIGQAIGRSRQAVDSYISDLRASFQMDLDLKILRMNGLHIPQERMANRLGVLQQTISIHLQKMPELAKLVNTDLSKGFTVSHVAEKHGWTKPLRGGKKIKNSV